MALSPPLSLAHRIAPLPTWISRFPKPSIAPTLGSLLMNTPNVRLAHAIATLVLFSLLANTPTQAGTEPRWIEPDWSSDATIPEGGRANLYQLSDTEFREAVTRGRHHAIEYPVSETGILIPWKAFENIFDSENPNPLRKFLSAIFSGLSGYRNTDDVFKWLGLHEYPETDARDPVHEIPYPESTQGKRPSYRIGVTIMRNHGVEAFTLGCATCHSSNLFGTVILGMTNRFPKANEFFQQGIDGMNRLNPSLFKWLTGATEEETRLYEKTRNAVQAVGVRKPQGPGLDTSLAQVALSLNHRNPDAEATRNPKFEKNPRPDVLDTTPADSKPAVWWNLKYKNRWLSDGSVVSGNPIFTNFIWNELGRGVDLPALESWLDQNQKTVHELTAAVFATEAPRFTDFFPASRISLDRAQRGELVYIENCAKCHGRYEKAWSLPNSEQLPLAEKLKTVRVSYPAQTRVKDVGTDPLRARGMKSLEEKLNPLRISKSNGIRIESQEGYVPPPLVGIWARWPYMHNNAMPSLCAVLTRASDRPEVYAPRPALDRDRDFDLECNGYPTGHPQSDLGEGDDLFDTRKAGMSNRGHDEGIFLEDGRELLSVPQKADLIQYLQTL